MKNRIITFLQKVGIFRTRSVKTLLKLMLENQHLFKHGLCMWLSRLYQADIISSKEYDKVTWYLEANEPANNPTYWFEKGDIQPRIEWINKQLEKL